MDDSDQDSADLAKKSPRYLAVARETCSLLAAENPSWTVRERFPESNTNVCVATYKRTAKVSLDLALLELGSRSFRVTKDTGNFFELDLSKAKSLADTKPAKMDGASGCDVCGVVRGNEAWVALPEGMQDPELRVRASNNEFRVIPLPIGLSGAAHIRLSNPLPGQTWKQGSIGQ